MLEELGVIVNIPKISDQKVIYVGNARCYHTMDWYRSAQSILSKNRLFFATDLIDSEGHKVLVTKDDNLIQLVNIDKLLFTSQKRSGDIWRNIVKLAMFYLQVRKIKKLAKKEPRAAYHAHTMYYMFLCWIAKIPFIGTPQGSEILVRPNRSKLYRHFCIKSLKAAKVVTVDSVAMRDGIEKLAGVKAVIVQNGIDMGAILGNAQIEGRPKTKVLSIRGITPLYRIEELVNARNHSARSTDLELIHPFFDESYKNKIRPYLKESDKDHGRVSRETMYQLMAESKLVVSIPSSDSSPRSVYESIFCGACVAISDNPYYEVLPDCMKNRIIIVDLTDRKWFAKALKQADAIVEKPYVPSEEALNMFDQRKSMEFVINNFYFTKN